MKTKGTPQFYKRKIIPAHFESLKIVGEYIDQACQAAGFDASVNYSMQLAVDEACSNIIEHAYHEQQGKHEIECTCAVDEYALYVELHDHGESFNPTEIPEPNFTSELEHRKLGGLGLYFIRRLMDEVEFLFIPDEADRDVQSTGNFLRMVKYRTTKA